MSSETKSVLEEMNRPVLRVVPVGEQEGGLLSEAMEEIMTSSTNRSLIRFVKLILMTFFVTHFFACAFVITAVRLQ